jgi:2'-5' RNA ligase
MVQILTLRLDDVSQDHFEQLRRRHFPPARNLIPAHLTLFHHLPEDPQITLDLEQAAEQQVAFAMEVDGLRSLGRGVAYTLNSPNLLDMHHQLAGRFHEHLTPQDRQRFMPHIVIQNKVASAEAKGLLADLQLSFQPSTIEAVGLDLWEYLGGPWRFIRTYAFRNA